MVQDVGRRKRDMMQLIKFLPVDVYHKRVEAMLELELGSANIDAGINRSRDRGRITDWSRGGDPPALPPELLLVESPVVYRHQRRQITPRHRRVIRGDQ